MARLRGRDGGGEGREVSANRATLGHDTTTGLLLPYGGARGGR